MCKAQIVIKNVKSNCIAGDGRDIQVTEICAAFMTDLIGTTAYGMRFNSLSNPNADFRKQGRHMFRSSYRRYLEMVAMFFTPQFLKPFNIKFFDHDSSDFLRRVFTETIEQRIKTGAKRGDLIDLLIETRKKQEAEPDKFSFS